MLHHTGFPVRSVCFYDVGLCLIFVCSDRAASEHQRNGDQLERSEGELAPGAGCSDVPGQSPGD